ncbi:DUF2066 domain-containing protein [Mesorhizobium sp. J428]|uniref:DUF2066 domain-containing protein n=1 Tax=Mesorhizobium sp. J428 TaxID=2898440 RepID=UPI0021511292|nr:DUF2066 domain-containing protein [Mesorhizobium sp. J428]MCR5859182.1 DUF2066 domain-containing protein [Mesorhizobium sp. J428]
MHAHLGLGLSSEARQWRAKSIGFAEGVPVIRRLLLATFLAGAASGVALAQELNLYSSTVVVTGTSEENRLIGLRECVPKMLVRVSGDQRLLHNAAMSAIIEQAQGHVASFRYRDRLEGVPIHDEQGTYARPHDLTCIFDPKHVDDLLAQLGSNPWPLPRPRIAAFVHVVRGDNAFVLTSDGPETPYMRDSLELAASPLALDVSLPRAAARPEVGGELPSPKQLEALRGAAAGDVPLAITLRWSDESLGWIASFRMLNEKGVQDWSATGVSFDEAFRVALRGAAQILSGHGVP